MIRINARSVFLFTLVPFSVSFFPEQDQIRPYGRDDTTGAAEQSCATLQEMGVFRLLPLRIPSTSARIDSCRQAVERCFLTI